MLPCVAALVAPSPSLASTVAASSTRSERSCSVRPFAPSAFTDFHATMASADSPLRLPGAGSPQIRTRCFPARPPPLPPRLNPRLRCVVPLHRIVAGLDRRFLFVGPPVSSSLPATAWLPSRCWLRVVVVSRFHVLVPPTGDLHPIYIAPMLGVHHVLHATSLPAPRMRTDVGDEKIMKQIINILGFVMLMQFSYGAAPIAEISNAGVRLDTNNDPIVTVQVTLHPQANPVSVSTLQSASFEFSDASTSSLPLVLTPPEIATLTNNLNAQRLTMWKEVNCCIVTDGVYAVTLCIGTNRTTATPITVNRERLKNDLLQSSGRRISLKQ